MTEDKPALRINLHQSGEKTETLVCNWCGLPHPVEADYKAQVIARGKEILAEQPIEGVTPEDTWTCGACYLFVNGLPEFVIEAVRTECNHTVPKERRANAGNHADPDGSNPD